MRVPKFYSLAIYLFASISFNTSDAQEISTSEKTNAIKTIAGHIAANYVFPDKGGQIASYIQTANLDGAFENAQNWKEFDSMVTKSLREYSKDGHLYVKNDPNVVSQLRKAAGNNEEHGLLTDNDNQNNNDPSGIESKILAGNIGYLQLKEINISKKTLPSLYKAMRNVQNTESLIIDLRDNGGGGSEVGAVLESYFLPSNTPTLEFVSRKGTNRVDSTVSWLEEKKYDKPVYVIINRNTASAAEAFAFVLQQNKRAKIVGERSAGAAYMNEWFIVNNENYVSVSTAAPSLPGTQKSWEESGIKPDIRVKKGDPLTHITSNVLKAK